MVERSPYLKQRASIIDYRFGKRCMILILYGIVPACLAALEFSSLNNNILTDDIGFIRLFLAIVLVLLPLIVILILIQHKIQKYYLRLIRMF